jgi:ABC-type Fe3+-hydroxamate transport system substrate-binding protein
MIMRALPRQLPAALAIAALAAVCAASGSSASSGSGSNSAAAGTAMAAGAFPVTIAAAAGPVHVKSRPAAVVSLSPTATEMLYAIGAGSQVKAVDADSDYPPQAPRTKLYGLESGAAAAGGYPQLSAEYIIRANPGYIILADTTCCHQSAATVAKRPGWAGLTAVRDGHIILLNDDIASRWGPRVTDLLRTVLTAAQGGR